MALTSTATEEIKPGSTVAGGLPPAEDLVREYYEGIHRLARHLTRNSEDASDLAQLTFIKACSRLDRYDGRSSVRSWLAGILFHQFLHWRRARRILAPLFDNRSFDPTEGILAREILLQAIHSLPRKLRDTFLLVEVHGFSVGEASMTLRVPVGTVKSRLSAARTKLQTLLQSEENHEI